MPPRCDREVGVKAPASRRVSGDRERVVDLRTVSKNGPFKAIYYFSLSMVDFVEHLHLLSMVDFVENLHVKHC